MGLKEKLLNCEKVCGTHVSMSDIISSDIVSSLGYDFIWVDTEHSCIDYKELLTHITTIKNKGCDVLVRVHIDEYGHTKRVLEMGPTGVIFPMINTYEEALKAIKSTFYPPKGTRGVGPLRACGYGLEDNKHYMERNGDFVRCIQLETKEAIDNLEEIVKIDDIDCYIFGPCDLSASLGVGSNVFSDETIGYIKKAIKILKAHNKSIGVSTGSVDEKVLKFWNDLGINFISSGTDYDYIRIFAKENQERLMKVQGRK